jgi:hypothetical protein
MRERSAIDSCCFSDAFADYSLGEKLGPTRETRKEQKMNTTRARRRFLIFVLSVLSAMTFLTSQSFAADDACVELAKDDFKEDKDEAKLDLKFDKYWCGAISAGQLCRAKCRIRGRECRRAARHDLTHCLLTCRDNFEGSATSCRDLLCNPPNGTDAFAGCGTTDERDAFDGCIDPDITTAADCRKSCRETWVYTDQTRNEIRACRDEKKACKSVCPK